MKIDGMKWLVFYTILRPLIKRNYALRAKGLLPDEWYWADSLALGWGYTVDNRPPKRHSTHQKSRTP